MNFSYRSLINSALTGVLSVNSLKVSVFSIVDRTKKQIKEHYYNYLHPEIKKEEWTVD